MKISLSSIENDDDNQTNKVSINGIKIISKGEKLLKASNHKFLTYISFAKDRPYSTSIDKYLVKSENVGNEFFNIMMISYYRVKKNQIDYITKAKKMLKVKVKKKKKKELIS